MADSGTAGYFGGGVTTTIVSTVDKIAFAGDTKSTLATGLSVVKYFLNGFADGNV